MTATPASKVHTRANQKSQYVQPAPVQVKQYQSMLSNGTWYEEKNIDRFIERVIAMDSWYAKRENRPVMTTAAEVKAKLATGTKLRYDTDWHAYVRELPAPQPMPQPKQVTCSCGHTVNAILVMSASMGSSCPDCYDSMSD